MLHLAVSLGVLVGLTQAGSTSNASLPVAVPPEAAPLSSAPVGMSFEFFMWPSYMTNITPPIQCMAQMDRVYGTRMPIRVGGTTQDRATYDPNFDGYVSYEVDNPLDAPETLLFGPAFFDLIGKFGAPTQLGFNRALNNKTNTFEAVLAAKARLSPCLSAIELGNEPDLYLYDDESVAVSPWNATQEAANAADWSQTFVDVWEDRLPILSGGVYAGILSFSDWPNTDTLINYENDTIRRATKNYNTHEYSDGTVLSSEMNHATTCANMAPYAERVSYAAAIGKEYILGETNFHPFNTIIDATFGSALQTLDKSLRAMSIGIQQLYFHQGTINQEYFNWFSSNGTGQINAPFYGGYFAALAVAGADRIVALDSGNSSYAQYGIYKNGFPSRAVFINTDYFSGGDGCRNNTAFTLFGLGGKRKVRALRMTAASSEVILGPTSGGPAGHITIGGQSFDNSNCAKVGRQAFENVEVVGGKATVVLQASEAILLYMD